MLRTAQLRTRRRALEFGETHVFVGERYVVSVRHGSLDVPRRRARALRGARRICSRRGPGFVLYALMDFIVDQYFPIVDALEDELEELEEEIFGDELDAARRPTRIYELKRDLLALKRAVSPLIDVCNRLMRYDIGLIPRRHAAVLPRRLRPRACASTR